MVSEYTIGWINFIYYFVVNIIQYCLLVNFKVHIMLMRKASNVPIELTLKPASLRTLLLLIN
jgi:hypothetical protein